MSADAAAPDAGFRPDDDAPPLARAIWEALDEVPDPHLPLSLVEMAMIYDVRVSDDAAVVEMTYPCLGCPAYEFIQEDVREACAEAGAAEVEIDVVWEPVWSKDMLPARAREALRESGIGL